MVGWFMLVGSMGTRVFLHGTMYVIPLRQEMIPKMIEAGTDIFRLNCSHRRGGDFERVYPLIRKTAAEMGKKAGKATETYHTWVE